MLCLTVKEISEDLKISKPTVKNRLKDCSKHYVQREFETNYYNYDRTCTAYDFKDIVTKVFKDSAQNKFFEKYLGKYLEQQTAGIRLSNELKIAGTHVIPTEISLGTHIYLVPEPDNPHDSKALKVFNAIDNNHLGYVYREDQEIIFNSPTFKKQQKLFGVITDTESYGFASREDGWIGGQKKYCKWFI
ncbi:hypothetical protein MTBPR1_140034 [Candidatus Terasakiella magnetica]|uniref:HIRAN domain-containing protein n=1 Tax=Candidatus Terasakiella magnetica TaxID=1867952 RepID=A0A1C3RF48_9PROT|nr:HIRAN domain-containing protein [Candidatus Terasakiella magnetica]SCA55916.1 hypothetical protein MTBPR1_140034 [Candidatus Terasakiella magnetica]